MSTDELNRCYKDLNPRPKPKEPFVLRFPFPRVYGVAYRLSMRAAHRLGFCWPLSSAVEPGAVWCHWCGMRGTKPVWDDAKCRAAVAEKLATRAAETPSTEQ